MKCCVSVAFGEGGGVRGKRVVVGVEKGCGGDWGGMVRVEYGGEGWEWWGWGIVGLMV